MLKKYKIVVTITRMLGVIKGCKTERFKGMGLLYFMLMDLQLVHIDNFIDENI